MSEARESGPFVLESREEDALRPAGPEQRRAEAPQGLSAGPRIIDISKYPSKQGVAFTDLGPDTFQPGETPLGQAAQEYVLANGRHHKLEFLLAFDAQGKTTAQGYGEKGQIRFPAELRQKMLDPREAVVLHHNHPDNTALSYPDISALAPPGTHAIWAHGHGGAVSRAALTVAARKAVAADPIGGAEQILALSGAVYKRIEAIAQRAIDDGRISHEADFMLAHLVDVMMHDARIINYTSNLDAAPLIAKLNLARYLEVVTASIRSKFYGNRAHTVSVDPPAGGFRHPGDLGATFAQADAAATKHNAARPDDP